MMKVGAIFLMKVVSLGRVGRVLKIKTMSSVLRREHFFFTCKNDITYRTYKKEKKKQGKQVMRYRFRNCVQNKTQY